MSGLPVLSQLDFEAMDARVQAALRAGQAQDLAVLGWGEVTSVVGWSTPYGRFACKRLPEFGSLARFRAYEALFEAYLDKLAAGGVRVVETELRFLPRPDGRVCAYCIQEALEPDRLMNRVLARCDQTEAVSWFDKLCDRILAVVGPRCGLDAQVSNWVAAGGRLSYLDVTTPLLRDDGGRPLLDVDVFLAAIPWALRWGVRRFILNDIVAKYCRPRDVIVDLLGNLRKEGLDRWTEVFRTRANGRVSPAIDAEEVRKYYRSDARTWWLLLALRRMDRFYHLKIRRKPYPFLLPGKIDRHV